MELTSNPSLVFHTRRLTPSGPGTEHTVGLDLDLARFAGSDGVLFDHQGTGFAGRGIAAKIPITDRGPRTIADAVATALRRIEPFPIVSGPKETDLGIPDPRAWPGPVAFGALPFARDEPAELIVPREIVRRDATGELWLTTIGTEADLASIDLNGSPTADAMLLKFSYPDSPPDDHGDLVVEPTRSDEAWIETVRAVRDELRRSATRKAVIARELLLTSSTSIDVQHVLDRLRVAYPQCYRYSLPIGHGRFVGATPELLVQRDGDAVHAQPMAGTTRRRTGDPVIDAALAQELLGSLKDQIEHRITIDMVHETLLPWCSYLDEEAEPSIVAMANVGHLATRLEGRLSHPPASVLELASALHPTPAVGGYPRADALRLIADHEHLDRGWYAGPVGWVDAEGNGTWAVALRCAEISADGRTARLFAGVGVVPDSDPDAEFAETDAKFAAMLGAFGLT